jgi:hypothetical protein
MDSQTLKYLFIEQLPVLWEGFHDGIKNISENNPYFILVGKEIITPDLYISNLDQLLEDNTYHLIWMNMDFPIPLQAKQTAFSLLYSLKKRNPEVRVLVTLQQATVYSLRNIFQKINPHAILELVDCDHKTIASALNAVIQKEIFYSKTVLLLLHRFLQTFETMDNAEYTILHELYNGTAINNLPEKVLLSHSTILIRRTNLKALFNLDGKTDAHLVQEVKRQGYI